MGTGTESRRSARRFPVGPTVALPAAALLLGALSLLYPSTPSYDQWAWLIWGREITQFDLQTTGGPSWKPLPVMFTVPFALFGGAAPDLWLVVARAGAVLSLMLAFVLAGRLCEAAWGTEAAPRRGIVALVAGAVAAGMVLLQLGYLRYAALGDSEGIANAAGFAAIIWHLDRRWRAALLAATAVALLRPEMWPFLGCYGAWLWFAEPQLRRWLVGCAVAIPILWFVPEYIGSGDFLRAASRAQLPNANSPAFADSPFIQLLENGTRMIPRPLQPLVLLSLPFIGWAAWRRRWTPIAVFVLAAAWVLVVAAMTQAGFAGNRRYLMLGTSLLCVLGGFGVGSLLVLVRRGAEAVSPTLVPVASVLFALLLPIAAVSQASDRRIDQYERLDRGLKRSALHREKLAGAVELAGGKERLLACGAVSTENYQVTRLAWFLGLHTAEIEARPVVATGDERAPAPGTAFQAASPGRDGPRPLPPIGSRKAGKSGPWIVFQACQSV